MVSYEHAEKGTVLRGKPYSVDGTQFIDAGHPYLRYVGRWTSTRDRTGMDGSFPGKLLF